MKKKIIIYAVILTFLLCMLISSIYAVSILQKKPKVTPSYTPTNPIITEEYNDVTSKLLKKYEGKIVYNKDTKEIMEIINYDNQYILGIDGKLYPDKIKYVNIKDDDEDDSEIIKFGRYEIRKEEDKNDDTIYYYYDKLNKTKSKNYDYIETVYYKDNKTPRYLLLNDSNGLSGFLDIKTNKVVTLNEEICSLPELENELGIITNNEYEIVAKNKGKKYGIINSSSEILVDFIYDNIISYKNGLFIAELNNKYGIIDKNNKTILNFEYDSMSYTDKYIIVTKNDKLGVLNDKYKKIVDYSINIDTRVNFINIYGSDTHGTYTAVSENNSLMLMIYPKGYFRDESGLIIKEDEFAGSINSYIISSKGIDRSFTVESNIEPLYAEDDNYANIKYYYSISTNDNKVTITFYDNDYYEYYKYTTKKLINSEYDYSVSLTNNICYIDIYYEATGKYDSIYLDLTNSKEMSEIDALYKYFDNGYGYILKDNVLTVYKDKVELNKFKNINAYLGKYLFSTIDNEIIELEFQKAK